MRSPDAAGPVQVNGAGGWAREWSGEGPPGSDRHGGRLGSHRARQRAWQAESKRQMDKQTERERDKKTDRQADGQADGQRERQVDGKPESQNDIAMNRRSGETEVREIDGQGCKWWAEVNCTVGSPEADGGSQDRWGLPGSGPHHRPLIAPPEGQPSKVLASPPCPPPHHFPGCTTQSLAAP